MPESPRRSAPGGQQPEAPADQQPEAPADEQASAAEQQREPPDGQEPSPGDQPEAPANQQGASDDQPPAEVDRGEEAQAGQGESAAPADEVSADVVEVRATTPTDTEDAENIDGPQRLPFRARRQAHRIARAAEKRALERLSTAQEEAGRAFEQRLKEIAAEAERSIEARLERTGAHLAEVLKGARETVVDLREQVAAGKQSLERLQQRRDEVNAQAAELSERVARESSELEALRENARRETQQIASEGAGTVRETATKASRDLMEQAADLATRLTENVDEVSGQAQRLQQEFSVRIDHALERLDLSSAELDSRAAELKSGGAELDARLESTRERMASLEQAAREQIEKSAQGLRAAADRQLERVESGLEGLEVQRGRLRNQVAQTQEAGAKAREQVVALEELVKTATHELTTRIGAAERELDRRLDAGRELVSRAAADRRQEREEWERLRSQLAEDLNRTTHEIREFFLVELAMIRSRTEALAEAGGLPPLPAEEDSARAEWVPDWAPALTDGAVTGEVDLNSAGITELRALGMTMTQARRVIEYREKAGGFDSVDELDKIPGFTHEQRARIKGR